MAPKILKKIHWLVPNNGNTPPLHIASRGSRFSTVTGVAWLNNRFFAVAHRSGKKIALFDFQGDDYPVAEIDTPSLIDDIAVKHLDSNIYEVCVSGCWDSDYIILLLDIANYEFKISHIQSKTDKTFAHGTAYDHDGNLWIAYHTGKNPRIQSGHNIYKLPRPWGARDICFDEDNNLFAVAVSKNPGLNQYSSTSMSVWKLINSRKRFLSWQPRWKKLLQLEDVHSDTCQIKNGFLYLPDQHGDRLLQINISNVQDIAYYSDIGLDFPHGIGISSDLKIAIGCYDSGTVTIIQL